jgi:hypothetical protein
MQADILKEIQHVTQVEAQLAHSTRRKIKKRKGGGGRTYFT